MKWLSVNTGSLNENFELWDDEKKLAEISFTKGTRIARFVSSISRRIFFFEKKGLDTLVEVNRKNAISSTHWIFSVDKRLPMRLVVLQLQLLQAKKASSAHKSETAQNYFAYANDSLKALAFTPFTNTTYQLVNKAKLPINQLLWVTKSGELQWQGNLVTYKQLALECQSKPNQIQLAFDGSMSFETYLTSKINLDRLLASQLLTTEWIVIGGDRVRSLK